MAGPVASLTPEMNNNIGHESSAEWAVFRHAKAPFAVTRSSVIITISNLGAIVLMKASVSS